MDDDVVTDRLRGCADGKDARRNLSHREEIMVGAKPEAEGALDKEGGAVEGK